MKRRRRRYPRWLTRLQGYWSILFPPVSEREFIRIMGQWWLRTRGFQSQVMVGPYRPDFLSRRRKQVIEIDGKIKVPDDILLQQDYFKRQSVRDDYLGRRGYAVLHIEARDVFTEPEAVRRQVKRWSRNPDKYFREHT